MLAVLVSPQLRMTVTSYLQQFMLLTGIFNPDVENANRNSSGNITLDLIDENGREVSFNEIGQGPFFVNIWATWCPPCIAELPEINKLYAKMKADSISFVMISLDEEFEKALRFKEKKGYDFPIYRLKSALPKQFNGNSIPRTYVVNQTGGVVFEQNGIASYDNARFRGFLKSLTTKATARTSAVAE